MTVPIAKVINLLTLAADDCQVVIVELTSTGWD